MPKLVCRRKPRSPQGDMALVDHFRELRRRVIISVIALAVTTIFGYIWYQQSLFNIPGTQIKIPSLGELLREPYCQLPADKRAFTGADGECRLLATSPFEMFMLRIKVGALAGVVLASPIWLYQIWAFITPGLKKNERKATITFVSSAVLLFVLGALLAYFVVDYGLSFLLTIGDETQVAALTGAQYFNFILALLLIFGVSFEVPLILVMLNMVGVLKYSTIKGRRDLIWIGLAVFAAVITPGQDPYSMLMLFAALCLLVEGALQIMRFHDRHEEKNRPEWLDVDDEEAAPLDITEQPTPIAKPAEVTFKEEQDKPTPGFFDDVL